MTTENDNWLTPKKNFKKALQDASEQFLIPEEELEAKVHRKMAEAIKDDWFGKFMTLSSLCNELATRN